MAKHLPIAFLLSLFFITGLHAQDVFDPSDIVTEYDDQAAAGTAANPSIPATGVMSKWIKTTRMGWNTSRFKSYIWNGMAFRMRFPNNYNPAAITKYPVIIFLHGGGEVAPVYDNENQLLWGAEIFEQRINSGQWNGFMIFPQETYVGWDDAYFSRVNAVLDTLEKYNHSDPDRTITMGLSAGGYGAIAYAGFYPKRVAAALAASPANISTLSPSIGNFRQVPIWMANGGVDANPTPYNAQLFTTDFRNAGGNIYQTYLANNGHNAWTDMWNLRNASGALMTSAYWTNAHKAQPLLYFQKNQFCNNGPIAARMALTAGYYQYQWRKNGAIIQAAVSNEYTATDAGQYTARFMRVAGGSWSDWSPNPVTIASKACSVDTLYADHFDNDNSFATTTAYSQNNFTCQGGMRITGTDMFSQDASGTQGNRFLVNYTKDAAGCVYAAGDKVWSNTNAVAVQPNTNYAFTFYLGNQNGSNPAQLAPVINGVALIPGGALVYGAGTSSWTRFSYTWNSGSAKSADLSIVNRTGTATGNEFALDEVSLTKAPVTAVPGCTANINPANAAKISSSNTALLTWRPTVNAAAYDVYIWKGSVPATVPVATVADSSFNATGLDANTQYNWYVSPKNSAGATAVGCNNNQTSFTTAVAQSIPSCSNNESPKNGAVTTASNTVTLKWTAAAAATSYDVYLWTGTDAPASATATVNGLSYNVTGLLADTRYSWYVVPKNNQGQAAGCVSAATVFTTASGNKFPSCTSNLLPTDGFVVSSTSQAKLSWTPSDGAISYDVYLWKGNSVASDPIKNVKATTYTATGLSASTLYNWYVVPRNANGGATGCITSSTSFNTAAPFGSPKCSSNILPADGAVLDTRTTAVLTWTPALLALFYDVYVWTGDEMPSKPTSTSLGATYTATGLKASTTYNWFVVPRNLLGLATGCSSNQTNFTTAAAPGAPVCTKNTLPADGSTLTTATSATLSWLAATNARQYEVYLWSDANAPAKPVATVTATSYNAAGLLAGTAYHWYVIPKNNIGEPTGCSTTASSFTTGSDITRGTGVGLQGDYYNAENVSGRIYLTRIDPTVNYTWGNGVPSPVIGSDKFSVKWTGLVQPLYSETYTFYVEADGGARLWVNGKKIISHWSDQDGGEFSGTIALEKGVKYSITLDYRERKPTAVAKLRWSGASTKKAIVPQRQLYLPPMIWVGGHLVPVYNDHDDAEDADDLLKPAGVHGGIYPNPVVHGQLARAKLTANVAGTATIEIASLLGTIVQRSVVNLDAGVNIVTVHTENLRPGLYLVRVTDAGRNFFIFKLLVR